MNRRIGYARVSTVEQTIRQQNDALAKDGCTEFFEDILSGSTTSRPGLDKCLATLEAGDTLCVIALDRLGRSMLHLVTTVHALGERGINFRSLRENIDTTTPTGLFMLHTFGALAELERGLIRERTRDAMQAKKARGERLGRKFSLTPSKIREAQEMIEHGKGVSYVARLFDVDRGTLYRAIARTAVA